jgi:hypothetical protein
MNSQRPSELQKPLIWALKGLLRPSFLFAPLALALCVLLAPRIALADSLVDAAHFAAASCTAIVSLVLIARRDSVGRTRMLLTLISLVAWVIVAFRGKYDAVAVVVVSTALVLFAYAVGDSVGQLIEDVGHLFPACVVAGAVDLASVIHPKGPTHAIVSSAKALTLSAVSFPIPGTTAFAPALGIGDLLFAALLFGAARKHGLSLVRMALLVGTGIAIAGVASALLRAAVPALPSIGLCVVLGYRRVRVLQRKDRSVAFLFMGGAIAVAAGTVASRFLAN